MSAYTSTSYSLLSVHSFISRSHAKCTHDFLSSRTNVYLNVWSWFLCSLWEWKAKVKLGQAGHYSCSPPSWSVCAARVSCGRNTQLHIPYFLAYNHILLFTDVIIFPLANDHTHAYTINQKDIIAVGGKYKRLIIFIN